MIDKILLVLWTINGVATIVCEDKNTHKVPTLSYAALWACYILKLVEIIVAAA